VEQRTILIGHYLSRGGPALGAALILGELQPLPTVPSVEVFRVADSNEPYPLIRNAGTAFPEYRLILLRIAKRAGKRKVEVVNRWIEQTLERYDKSLIVLHHGPWDRVLPEAPEDSVLAEQNGLYHGTQDQIWLKWLTGDHELTIVDLHAMLHRTWGAVYERGMVSDLLHSLGIIHLAVQCQLNSSAIPTTPDHFEIVSAGVSTKRDSSGEPVNPRGDLTGRGHVDESIARFCLTELPQDLAGRCNNIIDALDGIRRLLENDLRTQDLAHKMADKGATLFSVIYDGKHEDLTWEQFQDALDNVIPSIPALGVCKSDGQLFRKCIHVIAGIEWFTGKLGTLHPAGQTPGCAASS
jgi:hypothetical protein